MRASSPCFIGRTSIISPATAGLRLGGRSHPGWPRATPPRETSYACLPPSARPVRNNGRPMPHLRYRDKVPPKHPNSPPPKLERECPTAKLATGLGRFLLPVDECGSRPRD